MEEPSILAANLRRLRKHRRVSQQELADVAGVSVGTVRNIEAGAVVPRPETVRALARALHVSVGDLYRPVRILRAVRFRSRKKLRLRDWILGEVGRRLDDYRELEEIVGQPRSNRPALFRRRTSPANPVKAAREARRALGLDEKEPIHDICGLVEAAGIRLIVLPVASDGFFGLAIGAPDGGPAICVNGWERITVERRIFSTAHELGHLLLHPGSFEVDEVEENDEEEREADRFAGHLLLPPEGFRAEWAEAAGLPLVDRVLKVRTIFHVSYRTVLYRLVEEGIAGSSLWRDFQVLLRQRFGRRFSAKDEPPGPTGLREPWGLAPSHFREDGFPTLVRHAFEGGHITLSRAAELLGCRLPEMRRLARQWASLP